MEYTEIEIIELLVKFLNENGLFGDFQQFLTSQGVTLKDVDMED